MMVVIIAVSVVVVVVEGIKGKSMWRPIGLWEAKAVIFSESQLTDGSEVVIRTCQPPFTLQEDFWYSFLLEAQSTPGP
jgi:hypothetical protein